MNSGDSIDSRQISNIREIGGTPLLHRLSNRLLIDGPRRLAAIQALRQRGDVGRLSSELHAFKGSCAVLGLGRVASCCARIESRLGSDNEDDLARHFSALSEAWMAAAAALSALLGAEPME